MIDYVQQASFAHLFSRVKFDPDVQRVYSHSTLTVIKSPGDGHCLIHSVLCCMQASGVKAAPSKIELLSILKFEVLNNIEYYGAFLHFAEADFIDELDAYVNTNRYSSGTTDIVLSALANALRCRILLLKKNGSDYHIECDHHIITPQRELITPKFTIKLLWDGEHYDALVEESTSEGMNYRF